MICLRTSVALTMAFAVIGCDTDKGSKTSCVNESGYLEGCVNESGYITLDLSTVHYSAADVLTAVPQNIHVVATADTIDDVEGLLSVANITSGTADVDFEVTNKDGSFVFVISAAFEDTLEFTYTLGTRSGSALLQLDDDLSGLIPMQVGHGSAPFIEGPNALGDVVVHVGRLHNAIPLLLIYNIDLGVVESINDPLTFVPSIEIAARSGDTLCMFSHNEFQDLQGVFLCRDVP